MTKECSLGCIGDRACLGTDRVPCNWRKISKRDLARTMRLLRNRSDQASWRHLPTCLSHGFWRKYCCYRVVISTEIRHAFEGKKSRDRSTCNVFFVFLYLYKTMNGCLSYSSELHILEHKLRVSNLKKEAISLYTHALIKISLLPRSKWVISLLLWPFLLHSLFFVLFDSIS